MNCRDLEELLSAYVDGELSRTQREFIEEHLAGCADCRANLAEFEAAGRRLTSLREVPETPDIRETTMSKIKAASVSPDRLYRRWLRPAIAIGTAVIIIALLLVTQPWVMKSPEALAASIVRSSPEVREALDNEEIKEVEVTTSLVDDEGNVFMMLVRTEERAVATSVDLDTKRVTEVVRVDVPDFQPGDEQKALDVAIADPRVQDLLSQGGVIGEVHLGHSIDIVQVTGPEGVTSKEGTAKPIAFLSIDLKGKEWSVAVDLDEARVIGIGEQSAVMTLVHISEFVATIAAPILMLLGILLLFGLACNNRAARASAGAASLVLGITGLFIGLYAMSSIWWRLVIIVGVPAAGLVIGITDIRQRTAKRWLPITGIVLCALAMAFNLFDAVMVPDGGIGVVTGVAVVIAGIIVYALYEQVRKIPRKCWRPALMVGAAAIVLALAIIQPWSGSLEPLTVLAKTHEALENIQTYRLDYFGTTTVDGETSSHNMEVMFAAPDRYHITVMNDGQRDEFIIIGDAQYVTNHASSRGLIMASSDSFSSILTKEATLDLLDELSDLQTLPEENIGGVRCLHYLGKWDMEKRIEETRRNIQEFNASSDTHVVTDEQMEEIFEGMRSIDVTHEIWIGKEDYLIRQVKTEQRGPVDKEGILSVNMTMRYSGFNQSVTIEPPLDAEGNLLPGWELAGVIKPGSGRPVFSKNMTVSIGAQEGYDDSIHQEVQYTMNLTNDTSEPVKNVRIVIATMLLGGAAKPVDVEAEPETPADVMAPGESHTFSARIPFDASGYTKEQIRELRFMDNITIHFETESGVQMTESFESPPYPSAIPPENPPEK